MALALIWLFNRRDVGWLVFLYDRTIAAPALALVIRCLPLTTFILWFALRSVPRDCLDSATLDGAGPLTRLFRVALPQRWPAVAVAWLVAFAIAVGDLATSILVVPPGIETLARRIWGLIHAAVEDYVAGACLLQLIGLAGLILLARALWRRQPSA